MSSFTATDFVPVITSTFPTIVIVSTTVVVIILFTLTIILVSSIFYVKRHKGQRNLTPESHNIYNDNTGLDEYEKIENEEVSEPYYSEIIHKSSSGYTMKPNVSYNTLQASMISKTINNESAVCITYNIKPSVAASDFYGNC